MTASGSPYAVARRALRFGSPELVRMHAAELARVDLEDALWVCLVFLESEPAAFDRAAAKWLGRLCVERPLGLCDA